MWLVKDILMFSFLSIMAQIWTSTLQRTILTANPIVAFPKVRACMGKWKKSCFVISGRISLVLERSLVDNDVQPYSFTKSFLIFHIFVFVDTMACTWRDKCRCVWWDDIWRNQEKHARGIWVCFLTISCYETYFFP